MSRGAKKIAVFRLALKGSDGYLARIAQINKASPSAGVIAEPFDPIAIANRNKDFERRERPLKDSAILS
jgi:indole-3-glycerol phosphate synthase